MSASFPASPESTPATARSALGAQQAPASMRAPRLMNVLSVLCLMLAGALVGLSGGWPADGSSTGGLPDIGHRGLAAWAWALQGLAVAGLAAWWWARSPQRPVREVVLPMALFALSWQVSGLWWLHVGLHRHAGQGWTPSAAAVVALSAYLASFSVVAMGLAAAGWRRLHGRLAGRPALRPWAGAGLFAAAWLLAELGRAEVLTGFPWAAAGHAHLHGPMRPLVPWLGAHGAAALAAFVAAAAVALWRHDGGSVRMRSLGAAGLAVALSVLLGLPDHDFTQPAGRLQAALLQGNVDQQKKFDSRWVGRALDWHLERLSATRADLTLTPETSFPVLEQQLPARYRERLRRRADQGPGALMVGMPHGRGDGTYENALLMLGHPDALPDLPEGGVRRYTKQHLVPLAEFTPPGFRWFTRRLALPFPDFAPGAGSTAPLRLRAADGSLQRVAPLICFEDLFTEDIGARFRDPDDMPTVLANAGNLAWFEDSSAIARHLRIAQLRSLEFQRPTVRATNTGPTVAIDHLGRVTHALAPRTEGVLEAVVEARQGLTPYAWWISRFGLWPLAVIALVVLAAPWWCRRRAGLQPAHRG